MGTVFLTAGAAHSGDKQRVVKEFSETLFTFELPYAAIVAGLMFPLTSGRALPHWDYQQLLKVYSELCENAFIVFSLYSSHRDVPINSMSSSGLLMV